MKPFHIVLAFTYLLSPTWFINIFPSLQLSISSSSHGLLQNKIFQFDDVQFINFPSWNLLLVKSKNYLFSIMLIFVCCVSIFVKIAFKLQINLDKTDIFTIFILSIHEYSIFVPLLFDFVIFSIQVLYMLCQIYFSIFLSLGEIVNGIMFLVSTFSLLYM